MSSPELKWLILCLFLFSGRFTSAQDKYSFPPDWTEGIIWYQIFPERFNNGDTTNDPQLQDQKGAWPHELIKPWKVHPWTSDWYELQDYEKANQKDIWYNITRRRYGGDLQGVIDKLDYLKELGVDAIYLNPVFVSPSHHKYDIANYHHIDPTFGPDPEGDRELMKKEDPSDPETWQWTSADSLMLQLISEAHSRNIRIILDGVFNHAGYNFFAFQDLIRKQQQSKYRGWFTVYSWQSDTSSFEYEGWWGVKDMPEFREDEQGLVKGPRQYIFNITQRWMDPDGNGNINKGIDGWRLDVADQVSHAFWEDWRELVKDINPQAFLTAEVTGSINKIRPYLQGDEFDAVMNYNFTTAVSEFFIHPAKFTVVQFDSALAALRQAFPFEVDLAMQNFLGSHDTDRPLSRIMNPHLPSFLNFGNFFDKTSARNPEYITTKPDAEAVKIFRLMLFFQMTYPGSPVIYYGDEVGMWGAKDPGSRKPMLWPDKQYDREATLAGGEVIESPNPVAPDEELRQFIKRIISVRNENPVIKTGSFEPVILDNNRSLYGFYRFDEQDSLLIVINNSKNVQSISYSIGNAKQYRDLISGKLLNVEGKNLNFILQPLTAAILKREVIK